MTRSNPAHPRTDGTLTKDEFTAQLEAAGHRPVLHAALPYGTRVLGPYHRPRLDEHGKVVAVRTYYRITHPVALGSKKRRYPEARTKALALHEANIIDRRLGDAEQPRAAANTERTVGELIDAYLDPANHRHAWKADRSRQAPASFLNTWVRPVIGHWPCRAWDAAASDRIMEMMEKCDLRLSYRAQGYKYLSSLASFGRIRRHGFLGPDHDPLEDLTPPSDPSHRFIDPKTLPSIDHVHQLAHNLGTVVEAKWLGKVKHPDAARRERATFEAFRWAMLVLVMFGFGLRPNEALALRTGDFRLGSRDQGLGLHIDRQAARGSSTRTAAPKHGSERTTYAPDELWDDVVRLVTEIEDRFGPNSLLWPRMRDHTKMLDDSTLYGSYFDPAAERTAGFTFEMVPQWTVEAHTVQEPGEKPRSELVAVPLLDADGKQRHRKRWNWNWRHLRHLYGTTAIASRDHGGWGQDITDIAKWMGHRSTKTTWDYYIGNRDGDGARMAAGTRAEAANPTQLPPSPSTGQRRGKSSHLRLVS